MVPFFVGLGIYGEPPDSAPQSRSRYKTGGRDFSPSLSLNDEVRWNDRRHEIFIRAVEPWFHEKVKVRQLEAEIMLTETIVAVSVDESVHFPEAGFIRERPRF